MKTIVKVILVIALAALVNTSYALRFSNLRVDLLPLSSENAIVEITLLDSNFKITVANEKGTIIFSDENA